MGLGWRSYSLVTTLPSPHQPRCAFRVSLSDGRIAKLRRLRSEEEAERLCRLREDLPPVFVPVLARRKAVLLEPWIAGRRLRSCSERRLAQAAAMLRSLHSLHPPRSGEPSHYIDEVEKGLSDLCQARALSRAGARELLALALSSRPDEVAETLLHHDFCAENLVVARDGALWSIDNETLCLGPTALDLARVRHRWPMSEAAWRRFLAFYEGAAPSSFWHVLARLRGALVRVRYQMPGAQEAVDRLRDLLDGTP